MAPWWWPQEQGAAVRARLMGPHSQKTAMTPMARTTKQKQTGTRAADNSGLLMLLFYIYIDMPHLHAMAS
jgi:hypothetical protein